MGLRGRHSVAAPAPTRSDARRFAPVDSLKVALVCGVIVAHSAITYGADGSWFYRELGVSNALRAVLDLPLALGSLFGMGLFFFLAGCFVPASLARKGPRRFLADRWWRLGLPLIAFVLVVVPAMEWAVARTTGGTASARQLWVDQLGSFDAGPLWFAGVLLLFSTAYAAAAGSVRRPAGNARLSGRLLTGAVFAVAAASFLLRLRFRIDTFQFGSAHVWQWGQCLVLFAVGILAGPGYRRPPTAPMLCRRRSWSRRRCCCDRYPCLPGPNWRFSLRSARRRPSPSPRHFSGSRCCGGSCSPADG